MAATTLIHIVPTLPPQIDGVGDYALNLAIHMRQAHGIQARFIVCDPEWDGPSRVEDFAVRRLRARSEAGIWSLLAATKERRGAVLLHYVGDGYDKRGFPLWLYLGVRSWLMENTSTAGASEKQFSTVFHDVWPSNRKPWQKVFSWRLLERPLVEGLHRRSKISVAGTRHMQAQLDGIQPGKTVWLPMPSNMPMIERPKFGNRRNVRLRVAIFGQSQSRLATINAHANLLDALDKKNLLSSMMLIGKGLTMAGAPTADVTALRKRVARERIDVLGELSPEEVSGALGRADLYLSHHSAELACKSGAFMAALAAGCPPVLSDGRNAAPLREDEHFLASDDSRRSVARLERMAVEGQLERIATAGRLWYERNADWKVVVNQFREALFPGPLPPNTDTEILAKDQAAAGPLGQIESQSVKVFAKSGETSHENRVNFFPD